MVSPKGKRKIEYNGTIYYWYISVGERGHRVHIISEDKKVKLESPFLDTEVSITPQVIRNHLEKHMRENE